MERKFLIFFLSSISVAFFVYSLPTFHCQLEFYRFIPKGGMVAYFPFMFGRNKDIWGLDALDFRPERFLNKKEASPFKYPVFNAGYRTCLGKPLAILSMKLTLAHLMPRFRFVDVCKHSGDYKWTLVMSMKGGFPVQISRRGQWEQTE